MNKQPKSVFKALDLCSDFPNIRTLLPILANFPVTTAEADKTFSSFFAS